MTADLLRTCAHRLRWDADELTAVEGQLTNYNGGVVAWLRFQAHHLEQLAARVDTAHSFAVAYLDNGTLAWVASFRARVAAATALDELTELAAEARREATTRFLPGNAAAELSADLRRQAAALADAGQASERITRKRARMFVLLGEAGASDPAVYRPYMAETVGRPVESSKTLTEAETDRVIERLIEAQTQAEPEPVSP